MDGTDQIFVTEYEREVDVGAFLSERIETQRLRFGLWAEVAPADPDDDVDAVMSYDLLIDAVEASLTEARFNLLETLAERIADHVLRDPRALSVRVRIEKPDRVPGLRGIEIQRPISASASKRPTGQAAAPKWTVPEQTAFVICTTEPTPAQIRDLAKLSRPVLLFAAYAPPEDADLGAMARHQLRLLALDRAAWRLAGRFEAWSTVATMTEMAYGLAEGQRLIWAPARLTLAGAGAPDLAEADPLQLASWFGTQLALKPLLLGEDMSLVPM